MTDLTTAIIVIAILCDKSQVLVLPIEEEHFKCDVIAIHRDGN